MEDDDDDDEGTEVDVMVVVVVVRCGVYVGGEVLVRVKWLLEDGEINEVVLVIFCSDRCGDDGSAWKRVLNRFMR